MSMFITVESCPLAQAEQEAAGTAMIGAAPLVASLEGYDVKEEWLEIVHLDDKSLPAGYH